MSMATSKEAAAETLSLLEERLRRVDFVINGESTQPSLSPETGSAAARLRSLESSLQALAVKSPAITGLISLQKKYPELFHSSSAADVPTTLPTASLASLVLAHSQLYHSLAANLNQLQDISIPDPSSAAKLIDLQPRIEKARVNQASQAKEFAELRARSARVVEQWYESGVLGMGEQWAEWEERLRDAEILVRRKEAAKKREAGFV